MNSRNTIQDELNELNASLNANSNNPYSVPKGYFDGLAASVLTKIKSETPVPATEELAQLSPILAAISKKMPYSVPENYFQSNIEGLSAFTSESEESLVLSFIEKEMPFEVPKGYFANVPDQVFKKISNRSARVVPMKRKWMRMAAAALVAGIMVISGIFYFTNRGSNGTTDPVTAVKKASTEELNNFINTTAVTDDKSQVTVNNNPKTEKIFADISDKELNDFLDQMPTDDDADIN
jgi:hypothetical protein